LIHAPFAFEDAGEELHPFNEKGEIRVDINTDHVEIWSVMEKQVLQGRTKAIGLSNFNIAQIQKILNNAKLPISNLQIELHVYFQQKELVNFTLIFCLYMGQIYQVYQLGYCSLISKKKIFFQSSCKSAKLWSL